MRLNVSSGAKWEAIVGYSRAVRVGNVIEVAGTTAVSDTGEIVGIGDPYAQARFIFEKIAAVLAEADGSLQDVVRTRMYVTNVADWEAIGRAHGEFFHAVRPAATLVEVSRLIEPEMLVEIEAVAVVS